MDKEVKIALVGLGPELNGLIRLKDSDIPKVIAIEDDSSIIEINGVKWRRKAEKKPSRGMSKMIMMAAAFGAFDYGFGNGKSSGAAQRPEVDLEKEYELIQNKQSKLSSNNRKWVVYEFERLYTKVI